METKNNNPIDNVTWKGALIYLDRFVSRKLISLINENNISEEDARTLLGVSTNHIHLARKTYILENGGTMETYGDWRGKKSWITTPPSDTFNWAITI